MAMTNMSEMGANSTIAPGGNGTDLELYQICELAQKDENEYLRMFNSTDGFANVTLWKLRENTLVSEAMAFFYLLFFLIAFFWNLFILIMMCVRRKIFKEAAHVFLANLVLLDFLVAVFVMSFPIISSIQGEWILGTNDFSRCYMCHVTGFFVTFLVDMSVHVLAVLSVDRVLHLAWPLKYKTYMTRVKAIIIVVVIWAFVLALNVLPFLGVGIIEFNRNLGVCLVRWTTTAGDNRSIIYVGVLLFELLVPLLTLLLANTLTFQLISRVLKRTNERRRILQRASTRRQHDAKEMESHKAVVSEEERRYSKQQRQLRKYFTAVFISNIICWSLLFIVFVLLAALGSDVFPPVLFVVGFFCYLLTAIIHPMLETYFIQDLRIFFKKVKKGVRKELTRQTSSIVEKASYRLRPRDSQLNVISEVEMPGAVRMDLSLVEVGEQPLPTSGQENIVFDQIAEEEEEEVGKPAEGNRARESTSNESGVFSECPEQEPTQNHDTRR